MKIFEILDLTSREIVLLIYGLLLFIWLNITNEKFRISISKCINDITHLKIYWVLHIVYISTTIYTLNKFHIIDFTNIKSIILWCLGSLTMFQQAISKDNILKLLFQVISIPVIVKFFLEFGVYPIWVEFVYMPIFIVISYCYFLASASFFQEQNPQIDSVKTANFFGSLLLFSACFSAYISYQQLKNTSNLLDNIFISFYIPFVLTACFLPFILLSRFYVVFSTRKKLKEHFKQKLLDKVIGEQEYNNMLSMIRKNHKIF